MGPVALVSTTDNKLCFLVSNVNNNRTPGELKRPPGAFM
jgi:hypothetical protein